MDEMDEILAMGAQLDVEDEVVREAPAGSPLPDPEALVHEVGASYPILGYVLEADEEAYEEGTLLDPAILAGLVNV